LRTASIFFGNISASFLEAKLVSVIDKKNITDNKEKNNQQLLISDLIFPLE